MRLARRLGLDHNPMRRRSDVIEGWLLPAAVVGFLIAGPLLGAVVGLRVHSDNIATQRAERAWHRVPAVLLQAAPGPMVSDNGANTWLVWTEARWLVAGRPRVGIVPAAAGTKDGAAVRVWLDRAGDVQEPPLSPTGASDRVMIAISFALAALAVFLTGMVLLGRRMLDRHRLAGWEAAWLAVGPQWSRHP